MSRPKSQFELDISEKVRELGYKEALRRVTDALFDEEAGTFVGEDGVRYSCNRTDCYCDDLKPGENCRNWAAVEQRRLEAQSPETVEAVRVERARWVTQLHEADRIIEKLRAELGRPEATPESPCIVCNTSTDAWVTGHTGRKVPLCSDKCRDEWWHPGSGRSEAMAPYPAAEGTRDEAAFLERICNLLHRVGVHFDPESHEPNDCFCRGRTATAAHWQHSQQSLAWLEELVHRELDGKPCRAAATPEHCDECDTTNGHEEWCGQRRAAAKSGGG